MLGVFERKRRCFERPGTVLELGKGGPRVADDGVERRDVGLLENFHERSQLQTSAHQEASFQERVFAAAGDNAIALGIGFFQAGEFAAQDLMQYGYQRHGQASIEDLQLYAGSAMSIDLDIQFCRGRGFGGFLLAENGAGGKAQENNAY